MKMDLSVIDKKFLSILVLFFCFFHQAMYGMLLSYHTLITKLVKILKSFCRTVGPPFAVFLESLPRTQGLS